jgi:streptogramin lyase
MTDVRQPYLRPAARLKGLDVDNAEPCGRPPTERLPLAVQFEAPGERKSMCKVVSIIFVMLAVAGSVSAQTSNSDYDVVPFAAPPDRPDWGDTVSVASDGRGSILVLRRAEPPVLHFNRDGELQNSWGSGLFPDIHSIDVDEEGFVWITDTTDHMVYKFTMNGEQLLALGTKGVTGDNESKTAFNRPTDVVVAPSGDVFVTDGYGNSRIVHFSEDGTFVKIIGGVSGTGPGEFNTPHAVRIDSRGRLLVLDWQREAGDPRIQIFDQDGELIEIWSDLGIMRPTGITISSDDTVYVGDTDGNAIWVLKDGKVIDKIGGLDARPHNIVLDSGTGALYFADTTEPGQIKRVTRK